MFVLCDVVDAEAATLEGGLADDPLATSLAAIQSGTLNAADLMGWSDRTGVLEAGKWADIIAVSGDPLKDVKLLQNVAFVMKAGTVYKGPGAQP